MQTELEVQRFLKGNLYEGWRFIENAVTCFGDIGVIVLGLTGIF